MWGTMVRTITDADLRDLDERIAVFWRTLKAGMPAAEADHQMLRICDQFASRIVSVTPPRKLIRLRASKPDDRLHVESDVWWPPSPGVGRVNRAGTPILYTSDSLETALRECKIEIGDSFHLIQYSLKENNTLIFVDIQSDISDFPGSLTTNQRKYLRKVRAFLYDMFTRMEIENGYYELTNHLADSFMNMPNVDGYMYPSVAGLGVGVNFAIFPSSARSKLKFDCVLSSRYDGRNSGAAVIYVAAKANQIKDGRIIYLSGMNLRSDALGATP
jgi:hypothetical protein